MDEFKNNSPSFFIYGQWEQVSTHPWYPAGLFLAAICKYAQELDRSTILPTADIKDNWTIKTNKK